MRYGLHGQLQSIGRRGPWLYALHVNNNNGEDERYYPLYLYHGGIDLERR